MAKTKAKTVKVRTLVSFDQEGHFEIDDEWLKGQKQLSDVARLRRQEGWTELPHSCFVDIELPIPEPLKPLKGKVVKVKAVKQ